VIVGGCSSSRRIFVRDTKEEVDEAQAHNYSVLVDDFGSLFDVRYV